MILLTFMYVYNSSNYISYDIQINYLCRNERMMHACMYSVHILGFRYVNTWLLFHDICIDESTVYIDIKIYKFNRALRALVGVGLSPDPEGKKRLGWYATAVGFRCGDEFLSRFLNG